MFDSFISDSFVYIYLVSTSLALILRLLCVLKDKLDVHTGLLTDTISAMHLLVFPLSSAGTRPKKST